MTSRTAYGLKKAVAKLRNVDISVLQVQSCVSECFTSLNSAACVQRETCLAKHHALVSGNRSSANAPGFPNTMIHLRSALQTRHRRMYSDVPSLSNSSSKPSSIGNNVSNSSNKVSSPVSSTATKDALQRGVRAPGTLFKTLTQTSGRSSSAAYAQLPNMLRRWLASAQQPGRVQQAIGLQIEAFWQNHRRKVLAVAGATMIYVLWKTLFGVTSVFVNLSETMAELGFLALSVAIVAFGGLYLRYRFTIWPPAVYRQAMMRLNTHPALLEVMGAPLAGSDVRAQVVTGGGLTFKSLHPMLRSRRLHMIFPLRGSRHRGLVSVEAKRRKGKYDFKLLAVDVPLAVGGEQRIFLAGDESVYNRGSVINELRDPFIQAMTMESVYEREDEADEAADELAEEAAEAERAAAAAAAAPKPMDQGGGMYFWERLMHQGRSLFGMGQTSPPPRIKVVPAKASAGSS